MTGESTETEPEADMGRELPRRISHEVEEQEERWWGLYHEAENSLWRLIRRSKLQDWPEHGEAIGSMLQGVTRHLEEESQIEVRRWRGKITGPFEGLLIPVASLLERTLTRVAQKSNWVAAGLRVRLKSSK